MNILSVNKFFWRKGGSETVFFEEKDLLEKHGHSVIPFSMKSPGNFSSEYEEHFIENVDYGSGSAKDKLVAASKTLFTQIAEGVIRPELPVVR